jgi:hypothetical protein
VTPLLPLVLLAALAGAATLLLEQGGRRGYGWVTGSEFALAGFALGPAGLDLLSHDLLARAEVPIALGASWLGLGLGLRLRPYALARSKPRHLAASQLEPVVALLVLRALLEVATRCTGLPLTPPAAWALAAAGAATTRSMMDWVRAQHRAQGPVTEALRTLCTLDDLPPLLALAAVFAALPPHPTLLSSPLQRTGAMAGLGLALAALVGLTVARQRFRPRVSWLALFGATVLGTGFARELAVLPIASLCVCGAAVARLSRYADQLEEVTRNTQRPVVQLLLLLGGASVPVDGLVLAAAAGFALLRFLAKGVAGAAVAPVVAPRGQRTAALGLGLLGGGGVAYAAAFSASLAWPAEIGEPLLAGAVAMVLLGDVVGPKGLKSLLRRAGELWTTPRPSEARA